MRTTYNPLASVTRPEDVEQLEEMLNSYRQSLAVLEWLAENGQLEMEETEELARDFACLGRDKRKLDSLLNAWNFSQSPPQKGET